MPRMMKMRPTLQTNPPMPEITEIVLEEDLPYWQCPEDYYVYSDTYVPPRGQEL